MNPKVDEYINKAENWQQEMEELRRIILDCQLVEELKWRVPCYTFQEKNIALIGKFKTSCTLSFVKGSLLKDPKGILEKPGENSQSGRVIRFTNIQEIIDLEETIKTYIKEAIEVEKAGLKVNFKKSSEFDIPEELYVKFEENAELKTAFYALTPGRQKGYLLHFSAPKQSQTRTSRIEKYTQRILNGKGFHDCVCGHSKKMPTCDGSHKYLDKL